MNALRQAREALEAGDRVAALEQLLVAWREVKAKAIAEAIEAVSADVGRAVPALNPTLSRRLYQEAWLDLAGRPNAAETPRLLEGLAHPPLTDFKERLARLEARPDDPRIASRLARIVSGVRTAYEVEHLATPRVFRLLERIGDTRVRETLTQKLSQVQRRHDRELTEPAAKTLKAQLDRTLAALPVEVPEVPSDDPELERIAALARAFAAEAPPESQQLQADRAPAAQSEEQLLDQIYRAPDDDVPRRVYSDWLLERGDPRGEFIALQFKSAAGRRTKAEQKRERELLKRHRRAWLGPIEPVVATDHVEFERGFVSTARAQFRTAQQREQLLAHPAWNTLTRLLVGRDEPAEFVLACELRGLKEISGPIPLKRFHEMAKRERPYAIEALEVDAFAVASAWEGVCAEAAAFPKLTRLTLQALHDPRAVGPAEVLLRWSWSGALAQRLIEVKASPVLNHHLEWIQRYAPLPALRALEFPGLPSVALKRERRDSKWRARIDIGRVRRVGVLGRLRGSLFGQAGVDYAWAQSSAWLRAELPALMPLFESVVLRCVAQSESDTAELRELVKTLAVQVEIEVVMAAR